MKVRRPTNLILLIFVVVPLVALSCGDDGSPTGGGGGGGGGDTTPPGIVSVTGTDMNHLSIQFDEDVKKETVERPQNYVIVEQATPSPGGFASPTDTVDVSSVTLGTDKRTATITTSSPMNNAPYTCSVSGVEDLSGNRIVGTLTEAFTGTSGPDQTPPTIVFRSPSPGETNVGTGQSVVVQFSEGMQYGTVASAFSWTGPGGDVSYLMEEMGDNSFVFTPLQSLMNNSVYNVEVDATAMDWAGNSLAAANWSFTTTGAVDDTRPSLVSSTPANGATNVSVGTNLSLRFSEAMNQYMEIEILVTPQIEGGVESWSADGRVLVFDPDMDLMGNTQYRLIIPEGAITDLAGNGLDASYDIVFSTGSSLLTGSIEGTISGDPMSSQASDPEGAIVVAGDSPPGTNDDFGVVGAAVVDNNGDYDINNLPDGWYFPISILNSNGDSEINPENGDAVGAYGADFSQGDETVDSVQVTGGGTVNNVDFTLFDPSAITGVAIYAGTAYSTDGYPIKVAVFDTSTFDINNPAWTYEALAFYPGDPNYLFSEFEDNLGPGTFYIGGYMDVNYNNNYDPGTDPIGWYGNGSLSPVTVVNGSDALGIDFEMYDPFAPADGAGLVSGAWDKPVTTPLSESRSRRGLLRYVKKTLERLER